MFGVFTVDLIPKPVEKNTDNIYVAAKLFL